MKRGHKPYAATLRQLHHLEKQAKLVSETHGTGQNRRELILKFRALLRKLRTALHSKWWLRPAICIALYLQISIGEVTGQQFAEPVINPFGIEIPNQLTLYQAVDIDDDGDIDIFGFGFNSDTLEVQFLENVGDASENVFAPPVDNAFGISLVGLEVGFLAGFEDMDNDGDYDIIAGYSYTDYYQQVFVYFENSGSPAIPSFEDPEFFELESAGEHLQGFVFLGDIDNDGDIDLFNSAYTYYYNQVPYIYFEEFQTVYYENIGTPEAAAFDQASFNPFKIAENDGFAVVPLSTLGDLDDDGDLDLLTAKFYGSAELTRYFYQENTGTPSEPDFNDQIGSPFGLEDKMQILEIPQFVDFDVDGDLDIIATRYSYYDKTISIAYYENKKISAAKDLSITGASLHLSPNPVDDVLLIRLEGIIPETNSMVQIMDLKGSVIMERPFSSTQVSINIQDLPQGQYFLRYVEKAGTLTRRFVKHE